MSETAIPIALCLLSAVTVAGTNFFVKLGRDVLSTRMVVSIVMGLSVLPFAFFVPLPTPTVWAALGISIMAHWFYQFAMIRALHRGDLSLVFPVMRGLAPLLTAVFATVTLSETPSALGWIGLLVATAALIVFALPETRGASLPALHKSALLWAGLTAIGIALYSVVDARGARMAPSVLTFVVWLFLFDWIGITVALLWTRRGQVWQDVRPRLLVGTLGGLSGTVSYGAALIAFTMSEAATVTALRETGVVFGAIFGAVFLKEAFGARRIVAAIVLAAGLLLLEIGH